jgi:NADPH-dependent 2,4-dienoyl-CoA reductase/sulfur reductase-like enzyme
MSLVILINNSKPKPDLAKIFLEELKDYGIDVYTVKSLKNIECEPVIQD